LREYTRQRDEIAKMSNEGVFDNYDNFLRKYLMYARTFEPIFSEEAKAMLNDYLVNIAAAGVTGLPRKLESLESTAIALAKLKLKNVVDAEEATETMKFFNVILIHFKQTATISKNPRDTTYSECVNILKESSFPLSFEELIKSACQSNEQVKRYIGDKYQLEHNKKLGPVLDLLRNDRSHIKEISQRPVVLLWITTESNIKVNHLSDPTDLADPGGCGENKKSSLEKDEKNENDSVGDRSDKSERSDSIYISSYDSSITTATQSSSLSSIPKPIVSVGEFFHDEQDVPYQPLSPHTLDQSPCYPIINKIGDFYHCKLHPKVRNIHLDPIEQHCKYKDPDLHKAEVERLTSESIIVKPEQVRVDDTSAVAVAARKNILYGAFQVSLNQKHQAVGR
jgi:MCM AAA-lid domain